MLTLPKYDYKNLTNEMPTPGMASLIEEYALDTLRSLFTDLRSDVKPGIGSYALPANEYAENIAALPHVRTHTCVASSSRYFPHNQSAST